MHASSQLAAGVPIEVVVVSICIGMTSAVETGAAVVGAWTYRSPWHRVANAVASGVVVGGLSVLVAAWPLPFRAAGATLGVAYEG